MTVCEWLDQVRKLDELIDAKIVERDQLFTLATKVTVGVNDGTPTGNNISDPTGINGAKLGDMAKEIDALVDKYVDHKANVIKTLEKLPAKEYGVLHRYYIRYMTIEHIAMEMGYCTRSIDRIKANGLKILEDVVECRGVMC